LCLSFQFGQKVQWAAAITGPEWGFYLAKQGNVIDQEIGKQSCRLLFVPARQQVVQVGNPAPKTDQLLRRSLRWCIHQGSQLD